MRRVILEAKDIRERVEPEKMPVPAGEKAGPAKDDLYLSEMSDSQDYLFLSVNSQSQN